MSTGAAAAASTLGQQWTQNPNLGFGGANEHSLLGRLDPAGNAITKVGGDPLNFYGHKINPNALLFPSGGAGAVPGILPNLGPGTLVPEQVRGAFEAPRMGGGYFNDMAARAAGPLFNPSVVPPLRPVTQPGRSGR